jgi:hypothetical protein
MRPTSNARLAELPQPGQAGRIRQGEAWILTAPGAGVLAVRVLAPRAFCRVPCDHRKRRLEGPTPGVVVDLSAVPPNPAYAPLLLLLRLMRRLVAPSTRSEVTGTSSDLAACLVAVLPAGVVVDRSGPPQAPTDRIEQHAGPRESIEPAGDVAGVRQADHAVDSGNRALANRFPRHTIQSTNVTRERGTL